MIGTIKAGVGRAARAVADAFAPVERGPTLRFTVLPDGTPAAYEAGQVSRMDADFTPGPMGVNLLNETYLELAVQRITSMIDNEPLLANAANQIDNNVVGTDGIHAYPETGNEEIDRKIQELYWDEVRGVDVGREMSLARSQSLFLRECFRRGECLAYYPVVDAWRGHDRGPAIEIIEGERLPLSASDFLNRSSLSPGRRVRQAVEFDSSGRRVAYHVLRDAPNDGGLWGGSPFSGGFGGGVIGSDAFRRLDAADANLAFRAVRAGQIRGIPWAIASATTIRVSRQFREAAIALANVRASVGAYITGATGITPDKGAEGQIIDSTGRPMTSLVPGMFGYLPAGADIKFPTPTGTDSTFTQTDQLLAVHTAAGMGLSYAELTGDRTKSTFSADRSGALSDRKGFRRIQAQIVWEGHSRGWYERRVLWWYLRGTLKLTTAERAYVQADLRRLTRHVIQTPGWDWVNPMQEAAADEIGLATGARTMRDIASERGKDWRDQIQQRLREELYENEQREKLGLGPKAAPGQNAGGDGGRPADRPADRPEDRPEDENEDRGLLRPTPAASGRLVAMADRVERLIRSDA